MPRMKVPPLTATRSQPAHIQYMVLLLTNSEAITTKVAQGNDRDGHPEQVKN
jgi:hypothetical protein